jgi:hypothetical protein
MQSGEMRERVPCAALLQSWIPDEFWQHNAKKGLGKLTMVWRALRLNSKITISFWTKMALKLQF